MGMLGNQSTRNCPHIGEAELEDMADRVNYVRTYADVNIDQAICIVNLAYRREEGRTTVEAGDYHDEHLGGFGDLAERFIQSLDSLTNVLEGGS